MVKKDTYNAAVYLISSRKDYLFKSLESFYKKWNYKYNYPIYVHYYDDIYDDEKFRVKFYKELSRNIYFCKTDYEIPKHITEEELFYNRNYLNYVKTGRFTKDRLGYLHMQYFCTNISRFGKINQPNHKLDQYDYLLRIDDDIFFRKEIKYDLFKFSKNFPIVSGSNWNVSIKELKSNPKHGNFETRENLFEFIRNYISEGNMYVENKKLRKSVNENNEFLMHTLPWSRGMFIYNMKYFKTKEFYDYIDSVFEFGGNYKYRWGDIEIICLYNFIHLSKKIKFLNLEKKKIYDPKAITSFAPSTKINNLSN